MKLLNFRQGFASNSSSTHSVWISQGTKEIPSDTSGANFGWDFFVCSDRRDLLKYLAAQIVTNIERFNENNIENEDMKRIVDYLLDEEVFLDEEDYDPTNCYVDHQSLWELPRDKDELGKIIYPSKKYVSFIKDHILNNNTVIFGGNDNEDRDLEKKFNFTRDKDLIEDSFSFILSNGEYSGVNTYCVNDGEVWKFFDKFNGKKTTFTKDGYKNVYDPWEETISLYEKSSQPELIDLIITDKCLEGCSFCYRGCSKEGMSAPLETVKKFIHAIQSIDCFEVAIGGGDILQYSELDELLDFLKEEREKRDLIYNTTLKYNFSCYSNLSGYNPIKDKKFINFIENVEKMASVFSGIAFSIETPNQVKSFISNVYHTLLKYNCEPAFQLIPERFGLHETEDIIRLARDYSIPVVLLGYKKTTIGREANWDKNNVDKYRKANFAERLIKIIENVRFQYSIRMDTQLLKNFPELKDHLDQRFYRDTEGSHSCCLSAVCYTLNVSSYDFSKEIILNPDSPSLSDDIVKGFQTF